MTKNVNYKQCVCDFCKDEMDINQSLPLPNEWEHIKIGVWIEADLCRTCVKQLYRLVNSLKEGKTSLVELGFAEDEADERTD